LAVEVLPGEPRILRELPLLVDRDMRLHLTSNVSGYFPLKDEHVAQVALVAIGPEMPVRGCVD